jgi:hypothetical protein
MQENNKYKVVAVEDAGVYMGNSIYNYTILERATGKTCVLKECMLLDMEVFDEADWQMMLQEERS